jgi:chromosome segregation ATPase
MVALLVTGTATSAQAATIKQGVACATKGAKGKAGGSSYICQVNPAGPSATKLVWVTTDCITANNTYVSSKKQADSLPAQQSAALAAAKNSVDSWQNALNLIMAKKDALATNQYKIGYDATTHAMKSVTGLDNAYTALNQKISDVNAKIAAAQASADKLKATMATKYTADQITAFTNDPLSSTRNADKNVANYGNWLQAIANYNRAVTMFQQDISGLQKKAALIDSQITAAQSQLTKWTNTYNKAVPAQAALAKQAQAMVAQELAARNLACKAGL